MRWHPILCLICFIAFVTCCIAFFPSNIPLVNSQGKVEYSKTKQQALRSKGTEWLGCFNDAVGDALAKVSYHEGAVKNCIRQGSATVGQFLNSLLSRILGQELLQRWETHSAYAISRENLVTLSASIHRHTYTNATEFHFQGTWVVLFKFLSKVFDVEFGGSSGNYTSGQSLLRRNKQ